MALDVHQGVRERDLQPGSPRDPIALRASSGS